ncbi:MAG: glutamate mutase L [Holophaga sp.]|nr:glutamate mutase L [Holophaga sp.]
MTRLLSIDIGSTYTKGALFQLSDGELSVVAYAKTATTTSHLKEGFDQVRGTLDPDRTAPVAFSSSARGGLAIAAIGLVPDLTLKIAKQAALSAGGKVVSVHAYKLGKDQRDELVALKPDILLLAGGTDGGNESFVRFNATQLAKLPARMVGQELPTVIYAGNAIIREDVAEELRAAGFEVAIASNLMPQMEQVEPDSAREQIREVFLRKIVHGKGLDEIVAEVGSEPLPTPLAVLNLTEALRNDVPAFGDFILIDMGGATTDVYSAGETIEQELRVMLRGVRDPEVKRSVEGDLGMRVSAGVAAHTAQAYLRQALGAERHVAFEAYMTRLASAPEYLPQAGNEEDAFDRALASACIHHAILRHAGTWKRVFTAAGETFLQYGKDLRQVRKVIGSGGYLSAIADFTPAEAILPTDAQRSEIIHLIPERFTYYRDNGYLLPLLGNLVGNWRKPAVACAVACLREEGETCLRVPEITSTVSNQSNHC